ncbi:MAG TPA: TIGR01666 family membrane protein, partial [Pseudomonas sp.]|nr:TIGR01666 family membrane protein [Pseudomonas sp.]
PFEYGQQSQQGLTDLQASLEYLKQQQNPRWRGLLRSLDLLGHNLSTLERQFSEAGNSDSGAADLDTSLLDPAARSLREVFRRIRLQLTPT